MEQFYSIYKIILKEKEQGVKEENIKDLRIISTADTLEEVAEIIDYNKSYISSIKTTNSRYKIIDDKYIIYLDNTEEVI